MEKNAIVNMKVKLKQNISLNKKIQKKLTCSLSELKLT